MQSQQLVSRPRGLAGRTRRSAVRTSAFFKKSATTAVVERETK
jgi:hypothetical protein